ncbi:hypothetical protein EalM132_00148 [Exiguobacterium phage vB_EalM-132]|nr:hypothetical protein EalM132_00148 [Exiguobacterium phage vB_EalM-132]
MLNISVLEVSPDELENSPELRSLVADFKEEFVQAYDECYEVFPHKDWNNVLVMSDIDITPQEATELMYAAKEAVDLIESNGSIFITLPVDGNLLKEVSYDYQEDITFVAGDELSRQVDDLRGNGTVHLYPSFTSGIAYFEI